MRTFPLVGGILILVLVKKLFDKRTSATAKRKSDAASSATQGRDSSSSSFHSSGLEYEVFLSFRGEDTRKNFTDHLYNALLNRGIYTFRDNEGLRIGEKIDPALRSAIHQSKIAIPIFSTDYASSKWCLRELAEIVECMKEKEGRRQIIVMPVFYHVDPSDVRNQTGSYKKDFQNHKKKFGQETEGWKKALKEVGELKGWDLKNIADGHEGELIKLIVKQVWSELRKSPLIVSDDLVGINSHVEEMKKLLKIESNGMRIVVGIHGLGGIGKTTIARCVYNAVYHDFDGCCSFIADARETFQKRGPVHLQSQLIGNILNWENPNISSVDQGIDMIGQRLSNKRVFVVFDDVDFDLNAIIGKHNRFGCGSRIIITTRDKHILDVYGVDETYEPKEMDLDQSLQLFSKHAFKKDQPPEHYLDLSKDVVETTGGLPLALEVIGSSLFCTKESAWKAMAKKLKNIPNSEVQKKLKISYDGLDRVQKEMFLDIACFFIGKDMNIVRYIWDGCDLYPEIDIEVLRRRSLVKVSENNELRMHDQLRDLGREIVCQENPKNPGERSRLWSEQEIFDVFSTQMGTRKVEGLCIEVKNILHSRPLMSEGFAAMTNLRLLKLDFAVVSGNVMDSFSELRWLSLKGCRNLPITPTNPRKLVVLDLSSSNNITESWMGWSYIKEAEALKVLNLKFSPKLSQIPNLSANLQLEVLNLQSCVRLAAIDESIGHLKRLVKLNMKRCRSVKHLPTSICELTSLEILDISFTKISQLPENLGRLKALMELVISGTTIERLPNSIGHLGNLKTLRAGGCNIQTGGIPDVIGNLTSLEFLSLDGNQFHSLPETVSNISLLQTLSLMCSELQSLPELPSSLKSLDASGCAMKSLPRLSNLTNLEELCLNDCENLAEIPTTINALTRLNSLSLERCPVLHYIPHLPSSLTRLIANSCESVKEIPAFSGNMRNLVTLCLNSCSKLEKIECLEGLDSLQELDIDKCSSLEKLPKLQGSKKLRFLKFIEVGFSEIESLGRLHSLEELIIGSCNLLRKIPNLSDSKNLLSISIESCSELSEIEGLEGLESLVQLDIRRCQSLRKIQLPKKLQKLYIDMCEKLSEIAALEALETLEEITIRDAPIVLPHVSTWKNLKYIDLSGCDCMERLPDLSNLNKLHYLRIKDCGKLIRIPSVDRLDSLEELRVYSCKSMEILPDLSNLTKLRTLRITGCEKLTEIQGVDRLEILEVLRIDGCTSIETLPCLSNLKKLRILSAVDCRKLTGIQGADRLESLRLLNINKCTSIETLPCLSNLKKLSKLSAVDCKKLTQIQGVDEMESLVLMNVRGCISMKLPDPSSLSKLKRFVDPNSDNSSYDFPSDPEE